MLFVAWDGITAIEIETRKQAIISRKEQLENDASIILSELNSIVTELQSLDVEIENSKAIEIISNLKERLESRRRGDVVITIDGRIITLNRDLILSLPMGRLILSYFQLINSIANKDRKANKQKQADV